MQTEIWMTRRQTFFTIAFIILLLGFSIADIAEDLSEGTTFGHIVLEAAVVSTGIVALLWIVAQFLAARKESADLSRKLDLAREEATQWRERSQHLLRGLGEAIDEQLQTWSLTVAEKEVALLLLKGLSMKDISGVRNTSERTCRQQAAEIYRKSGLGGRAEFSAFFLEDLLLPMSQDVQQR